MQPLESLHHAICILANAAVGANSTVRDNERKNLHSMVAAGLGNGNRVDVSKIIAPIRAAGLLPSLFWTLVGGSFVIICESKRPQHFLAISFHIKAVADKEHDFAQVVLSIEQFWI